MPVAGQTEGGGGGVGPHDGGLLSPDDLAGLDVPTGHTVPGQRVRDGEMLIFSPAKLRVSFYYERITILEGRGPVNAQVLLKVFSL